MHINNWWEALKPVVASVTTLFAAFLLALFTKLPEKLLDKRFKRQLSEIEAKRTEALEALKHEQQTELENLRSEIQRLYSRISKIHEKEFEVLPKAWLYLHEAQGAAISLISRLRSTYNLDAMPTDALEEHMTNLKFSDAEKQQLRIASDKQRRTALSWKVNFCLMPKNVREY